MRLLISIFSLVGFFPWPANSAETVQIPAGTGRQTGTISFHAVTELAGPMPGMKLAAFTRTQVSRDNFVVDITWVEPHWLAPFLPFYPVSARLQCDQSQVYLGNEYRNEAMMRPFTGGLRPPIDPAIGSYDPFGFEFALGEANRGRVTTSLLRDSIHRENTSHLRLNLKAVADASHLKSLSWRDGDKRVVESIQYEYSDDGKLRQQIIEFPQRNVLLKFNPVAEKREAKRVQVSPRTYSVHWDDVAQAIGRLPIEVRVATKRPSSFLERLDGDLFNVKMSGFAHSNESIPMIENVAKPPVGLLTQQELRWFRLRSKCWMAMIQRVPIAPADITEFEKLKDEFKLRLKRETDAGVRLRLHHQIVMTSIMLHDATSFRESIALHFNELEANKLDEIRKVSARQLSELLKQWQLESYQELIPKL